MSGMPLPEAAVYIADELGWPILPVWWLTDGRCACPKGAKRDRSPGKHPVTAHGLTEATTDPAVVAAWWARWPDAGVGIRCDQLLVIDLDNDEDGNPVGWDNWLTVADPYGWTIEDTLVCTTRGNGVHVYYWLPDGILDGSGASDGVARHVDTRFHDNYVIAPPTPGYEVLVDGVPVLAPAWLTGHVSAVKNRKRRAAAADVKVDQATSAEGGTRYGLAALESELGRLALAAQGTRNDTLVRAAYRAGQLVAGGQLDAFYAHDVLAAVALRTGLGEDETEATIESGMTAGADKPRRPAA